MTVGTKSLLFGVHQVFIHPIFVAIAWYKLYGFPKHPALWLAFVVHDWGYFGKPNMDGAEGERHPELGGEIMRVLWGQRWGFFTLLHSRHYAKILHLPFSQLCVADKLATCLYPPWLYFLLGKASGELYEYLENASHREASTLRETEKQMVKSRDPALWFEGIKRYLLRWVFKHRDMRPDTWTDERRT